MSKRLCMPLLALLLFPVGTSWAAEINRCTAGDGRVSYSDQPCPEGSAIETIVFRGQPKLSDEPLNPPATEVPDRASRSAPRDDEVAAEAPAETDQRLEQLRRLNFLVGELVNSVAQAGNDCPRADTNLRDWLRKSAPEAAPLWPAWRSVRDGEPPAGEELAALGELIQSQVRSLESEVLTRLTAVCWEHPQLADTIDAVRRHISAG